MDLGLFTSKSLSFCDVYDVVIKVPLYGKTRAVNLVRSLSVARQAQGLPALTYCETAWETLLGMHDNVRAAATLQGVTTLEEAETSCRVISSLCILSCKDPNSRAAVES